MGRVANLLEPPLDAVTRLQAKIVPGEEKQVTSQLWGELMLLDGFVRGLTGKGVTWVVCDGANTMKEMVAEMMEAVRTGASSSGVIRMESDTMMD